jgi:glycosyltransferase involved in cell wall biosynthesis
MKVSIAVCTYNGQKYLEEQLHSLIHQTYTDIEIVVVDDHSTDDTFKILKDYQEKYPHLKCFQNDVNLGYVKNFEKAISLCEGDYIALCDQDDIWDLDKIELQITHIGNHALAYHDSSFIDEKGDFLPGKLSDVYPMYEGAMPHPFLFFNCVSGHSILFHKRLIPHLIPFDKRYFHDRWIAFIAAERGGIKLIPKSLVKYRQHIASSTDALKIKEGSDQQIEKFFNPLSISFVRNCKDKSVKHKAYFNAILSCFDDKLNIIRKYKLFFLLLSKQELIFFCVKKSYFSKVNYIRKICFLPKHTLTHFS